MMNHYHLITLINNVSGREDLVAEHGLSIYISGGEKRVLFDTGDTGRFIDNAKTLGVDLNQVDVLVFSHGHYDHVGGSRRFSRTSGSIRRYELLPKAIQPGFPGKAALHRKHLP